MLTRQPYKEVSPMDWAGVREGATVDYTPTGGTKVVGKVEIIERDRGLTKRIWIKRTIERRQVRCGQMLSRRHPIGAN